MSALIIEQTHAETKLAIEVSQNISIDRLRIARARVESHARDNGPKPPIAVTFNFKSKPLTAPANILRLEIAFRMAGMAEKDGKEAGRKDAREKKLDVRKPASVVLVECAYEVDYLIREGFSITPAHVKAFKDGNAIFNAWPFFREYLQNNVQRMGLPPLTAPFLRLQPKPEPHKRGRNEAERSLPGERRQLDAKH